MWLLALALAPIVAIVWYIIYLDKLNKEPVKMLLLTFLFGVISVLPAILLEMFGGNALGQINSLPKAWFHAFIVVALSEELAKYFFLRKYVFSKPYFDKGKAWDFETLERNIYVNSSGEFVWFDELLRTWMGTCRGSGVLEKIENSWKIKHYVLSVSIPNEDINRVITIKKKNDSIFLKKFN